MLSPARPQSVVERIVFLVVSLDSNGRQCDIAAPTGPAAIPSLEVTIHRFADTLFEQRIRGMDVSPRIVACSSDTFASRLMMAGVGLHYRTELMGPQNIQMTCCYAHLGPQPSDYAILGRP